MLEHMSKTLPVSLLIFRADVIPQLNCHYRRRKILQRYHIQTILKLNMSIIKPRAATVSCCSFDTRTLTASPADNQYQHQ
ncbi:hypothetical protein ES703_68065 [subsurface metagenome]